MLQSEPRGSLCAVAFMVIEADLEAFSPGRAARLTMATAVLRKASELFKHSCTDDSHNSQSSVRVVHVTSFYGAICESGTGHVLCMPPVQKSDALALPTPSMDSGVLSSLHALTSMAMRRSNIAVNTIIHTSIQRAIKHKYQACNLVCVLNCSGVSAAL